VIGVEEKQQPIIRENSWSLHEFKCVMTLDWLEEFQFSIYDESLLFLEVNLPVDLWKYCI